MKLDNVIGNSRDDESWTRWIMQTARSWEDIAGVIKETGIEVIDFDHRQMTEAVLDISNLLDLVEGGGLSIESIRQQEVALENLYAYTARHFAREYQIIKKYDLPGLKEQSEQHMAFLNMLREMIKVFREGKLTGSNEVRSDILDWWVRHINEVDYNTFCSGNWTTAIIRHAETWDDVADLIKSTGVESLDNEHREMTIAALNLMEEFRSEDHTTEHAIETISKLQNIARNHFMDEEIFIDHFGLPGLDAQRHEHKLFTETLERHKEELKQGVEKIGEDLRFEIVDWWINHINTVDYASFSLSQHAAEILAATKTWEEAAEFIKSTDVPSVNEDHHQITLLIIDLDSMIEEAATDNPGWHDRAADYLLQLVNTCQRHFKREEKIMEETVYAGIAQHIDQHRRFIQKWTRMADNIRHKRAVPTLRTKHSLLDWWVTHIREFDMKAFSGRHEITLMLENTEVEAE